MNGFKKMFKIAVTVTALCLGSTAFAGSGDTSIASLNLSGSVPEVFSITVRGLPGDLDLTPNVVVVNRLIGILHFKFNENAASIKISGAVGGVGYTFGAPFKVSTPACTALDNGVGKLDYAGGGVALAAAPGVDYKALAANPLVGSGIEEDCSLTASWTGTAAALPLAGIVTVTVTVTMIAL